MLIKDFFANREVFVTGGTGFLGKALIEKLLYDSPKIKVLYILLRGKKSLTAEQRLEAFKKDKVFDRINQHCPEALNKLHVIEGNCIEMGLGIRPADLKLLQNVSIILHMAANVRFDDPLKSSILLNTRGTYELIKIAEGLRNLVVFMHCSTAYCNPFEKVVEERVYKCPVEWRKAIQIAETCDEDTLNYLSHKFTGFYPNTYSFTKNLSEQIIQEYSTKLPMCLFRPSIVTNAHKEPAVGWIDNMNGPIAGMVGVSAGVLPVGYADGKIRVDYVPIDMVTRLTVVAVYKRGMQMLRKEPVPDGLEVVNCVSANVFKLDMTLASVLYQNASIKNPMENKIWHFDYPLVTSCYYNFLLKMLLMNIPMALAMDTVLRLTGRPPIALKMSRRVIQGIKAVKFFIFNEYQMINKNMMNLEDCIPQSEQDTYGIKKDFLHLDYIDYYAEAVCGFKYYLFNQPAQASAAALKRSKILINLNKSIKWFISIMIMLYLWSIVSKF